MLDEKLVDGIFALRPFDDIYDAINLETCVNQRKSEGGPAPDAVSVQIAAAEKAFEKVMDGLVGVNYLQLALLGTQVVAGTNYAILAERSVVSPDATPSFCVMFIYEDLQGNATLNSVYPLDLADFNK